MGVEFGIHRAVPVCSQALGRIGRFHGRHLQELSAERGDCRLVAVVDRHDDTAARVAAELQPAQDTPILPFGTPEGESSRVRLEVAGIDHEVSERCTFELRDYGEDHGEVATTGSPVKLS